MESISRENVVYQNKAVNQPGFQAANVANVAPFVPVSIRHEDNVRTFVLPSDATKLLDIVRREFHLPKDADLGLSLPYGDSYVVTPFDVDVLKQIVLSGPNVFDLKVYSSLESAAVDAMLDVQMDSNAIDFDSVRLGVNQVIAMYDYDAGSNREITFRYGDIIDVLGRYNKDWFKGRVGEEIGYFPSNYVHGIENVQVEQSKPGEGDGDWQDTEYFDSYANLTIHLEMLQDVHRTTTYQSAINSVRDIQDKVVLDIGCGSGILASFCALAGAKHVYAVDASDVIHLAERVVKENGLENRVTLIKGKIEEIKLPVDKVDMIVSEWMGTMLICESMISSVLNARKLFLREGGLMLPATSDIFLVPLCLEEYYQKKVGFWNDVYGVKMTCLKSKAHKEFFSNPVFDRLIKPEDLMCDALKVFHINMQTDDASVLNRIVAPFTFKVKKSGVLHAFGTWFDSGFRAAADEKDEVVLTTSCFGEPTHWRNVSFVLEEQLVLEAGDEVEGTFVIFRNKQWLRHFEVTLTFKKKGTDMEITQTMPLWR
jgi:2-polyprenyl-3-methyl-5-hydroxy-6-metoxy-1,4-benzoquinol methylase